jgi:hypothetical protein
MKTLEFQRRRQLVNILRQISCVIATFGRCGAADASKIYSDDGEPLRQLRHDRLKFRPILWESMDQDDGRPFAGTDVIQLNPIHDRGFRGEIHVPIPRRLPKVD